MRLLILLWQRVVVHEVTSLWVPFASWGHLLMSQMCLVVQLILSL